MKTEEKRGLRKELVRALLANDSIDVSVDDWEVTGITKLTDHRDSPRGRELTLEFALIRKAP